MPKPIPHFSPRIARIETCFFSFSDRSFTSSCSHILLKKCNIQYNNTISQVQLVFRLHPFALLLCNFSFLPGFVNFLLKYLALIRFVSILYNKIDIELESSSRSFLTFGIQHSTHNFFFTNLLHTIQFTELNYVIIYIIFARRCGRRPEFIQNFRYSSR